MCHTVGQQDLYADCFRRVSRQSVAHLNRRRLTGALLQHIGHVLARVLPAREVKRDFMIVGGDRKDVAGEHARAFVGRFALQSQNPHARVVVVQDFALRRLPDQFFLRRLHHFGGFLDDLPLRGRGQRNAHELFQLLQPVKRNPAAVFHLPDRRTGGLVVLLRTYAFRLLRREDLTAGVAAQSFQFIDRSGQRSLAS